MNGFKITNRLRYFMFFRNVPSPENRELHSGFCWPARLVAQRQLEFPTNDN